MVGPTPIWLMAFWRNVDTETDLMEGRLYEETWGEDRHLEVKERGLEQVPALQTPPPPEGASPAEALTLDFPGLHNYESIHFRGLSHPICYSRILIN